jgi:hypothetical protein
MSARRAISGFVAGTCAVLALSACGGGARQDASEPSKNFTVAVTTATFPSSQRLSEHTKMVIAVRNVSGQAIPDLAVTVCNISCAYGSAAGEGTSATAFATYANAPGIANPSRAVWVVDQPPGTCAGSNGYSCQSGGAGGDVTADANTWALGRPLAPGATATFVWAVTAVAPGKHVVAWEIAAGLNGKAKAVLSDGTLPHGVFPVNITSATAKPYVNDAGQIVGG